MLGRFAHDMSNSLGGKGIESQQDAERAKEQGSSKLWDVMVEMTQQGEKVMPRDGADGEKEKKLLDVKYKIFREAVEVQKKWRGMVAEAVKA
jgi:hypothetical protein